MFSTISDDELDGLVRRITDGNTLLGETTCASVSAIRITIIQIVFGLSSVSIQCNL